jgi:peptidoglycan-associated lipoprotein
MKLNKPAIFLVTGAVLMTVATGCKTPQNTQRIPGSRPAKVQEPPPQPPLQPVVTYSDISTNTGGGGPMIALGSPDRYANFIDKPEVLAADTIHFSFDSSALKSEEKPKAANVADYLKANGADGVRIEGHCDERGTEEYNRSLGERRSLALREELVRLGIDPERVMTLSYGKDRPADPGHTEDAWSKNRRGEFILLVPPGK